MTLAPACTLAVARQVPGSAAGAGESVSSVASPLGSGSSRLGSLLGFGTETISVLTSDDGDRFDFHEMPVFSQPSHFHK